MKKLFAVAVAACLLAVSPLMAGWGYDPVIDQGSGEATFGYYGHEFGIRIRYSPVENFEIYSAKGNAGIFSRYVIGGRYQIVDDLLTGSIDFGIPVANDPFSLVPTVALKKGLTDDFSISAKVGLGVNFGNSFPAWSQVLGTDGPYTDDVIMNLVTGLEFGYVFTDQMGMWLGGEFNYADITGDGDLVIENALGFNVGLWMSGGPVGVATMIGMSLIPEGGQIRGKDASVGFWGGVEATVSF
jgi:hypothetical protein